MKYLRNIGKVAGALGACLATFAAIPLMAADYYVAVSGSNSSTTTGTQSDPFGLPSRAAQTATSPGDVIHLAAGTYDEPASAAKIILSPGVSMIGAGATETIITTDTPVFSYFQKNGFFIQLNSPSYRDDPAVLSDFAVYSERDPSTPASGGYDPGQISGGIVVSNRGNVTIRDVQFQRISWAALWLGPERGLEAKNILVDGCSFLECGFSSSGYVTGAINPAFVENVEIKNFSIIGLEPASGYGISSIGSWPGGTVSRAVWKRVKIHSGDIDLKVEAAWKNGQAVSIAIETNLTWPIENSEIYNCVFRNNLSLVDGSLPQGGPPPPTGKFSFPRNNEIPTLRVHHNQFLMKPRATLANGQQGPGNYVLELSMDDFEFDHNYVEPESFILAGFYYSRTDVDIHHNIFRGGRSRWSGAAFRVGAKEVSFYNNVCDWTLPNSIPGGGLNAQGGTNPYNWGFVFLPNGVTNDLQIKNNTFQWSASDPAVSIALLPDRVVPNLQVSNNFFTNIQIGNAAGTYTSNTTMAPQFNGSGELPSPWYLPISASSNTVDAGTTSGLPPFSFQGSAPDIGAYEFGGNEVIGINGAGVPDLGYSSFDLNFNSPYFVGSLSGQQGWSTISGNSASWEVQSGTGPGGGRAVAGSATASGSLSRTLDELELAADSNVEIVTDMARASATYNGTGKWSDNVRVVIQKVSSSGSVSDLLWFGGNPQGMFRSSASSSVPSIGTSFKEVVTNIDFATNTYEIELEGYGVHGTGTFSSSYAPGDKLRVKLLSFNASGTSAPQIAYKFGEFLFLADGIPMVNSHTLDFSADYSPGNVAGQQNWNLESGNVSSWQIESGTGPGGSNALFSSATASGTVVRDINAIGFSYGSSVTISTKLGVRGSTYTGGGSWGDTLRMVVEKVGVNGSSSELCWFGANPRGLFRSSGTYSVPSLGTSFKDVSATVDFATNTYEIKFQGNTHATGTFGSSYTPGDYLRIRGIAWNASGTTAPQTSLKYGNIEFSVSE